MLIPAFTVFENIVLGTPSSRAPFLDKFDGRKRILEIAEKNSLNIDLDARVLIFQLGCNNKLRLLKHCTEGQKYLFWMNQPAF